MEATGGADASGAPPGASAAGASPRRVAPAAAPEGGVVRTGQLSRKVSWSMEFLDDVGVERLTKVLAFDAELDTSVLKGNGGAGGGWGWGEMGGLEDAIRAGS